MLIAIPLLATTDLTIYCIGFNLNLIISLSNFIGIRPPLMENSSSLEVLIYNAIRIPLFLLGATFGFFYAFYDPEIAFDLCFNTLDFAIKKLFTHKMHLIKEHLSTLAVGEKIALPALVQNASESFNPAYNSHIRYILIEKVRDQGYQAELIERGSDHGKSPILSRQVMEAILEKILSKRFKFAQNNPLEQLFTDHTNLIDLGRQGGFTNCTITNLFALLQAHRSHEHRTDFLDFTREIR